MKLRGLFPSVGAGGSLIAAAVCAFAVFGGVLAFRGENPGTAKANSGALVVPGREVRTQTSSPAVVETIVTLARTGQRTARAKGVRPRRQTVAAVRRDRTRTGPRTGATPGGGTTAPGTTTPSRPSAQTPGGGGGGTPGTPEVPATPQVPTGTVERTVEQTRETVQPVVDAVPAPVKAPVEQVADTVQDVAGTVDETVDGVTGTLLP